MADDPQRDHDHTVERAVRWAFDLPTPENEAAAELAVSLLQRRYDHLLRRLDGAEEPPEYPVHGHDAADHPVGCLEAVLHELAGAQLADRAETLAHGLEAVHAMRWMALSRAEARAFAWSDHHGWLMDAWVNVAGGTYPDDLPDWLTSGVAPPDQDWWPKP